MIAKFIVYFIALAPLWVIIGTLVAHWVAGAPQESQED